MYRSIDEFRDDWARESTSTRKLLQALTDASLAQRVDPAGRTLGRIAWHIVQTLPEMGGQAGLPVAGPDHGAPVPDAATLAGEYARAAQSVSEAVGKVWTDVQLGDRIEMYGQTWTKGMTLAALVRHEIHHRGQLTVLMRQAGLPVPGVYGPSREEWGQFGMPVQE